MRRDRAGVRSALLCPFPLRERAARCCHTMEWVRGILREPLTLSSWWPHHCALSRKGRGHERREPRILVEARRSVLILRACEPMGL